MNISKNLLLSFIACTFIVTGCSKKSESPKSLYGQTTTLFNANDFATGNGARSNYLGGIAVDATGNIYVADNNISPIRKITPKGELTTFSDDGKGLTDNQGNPASNSLGLAIDNSGTIYASYFFGNLIRKITSDGKGSVFAGGRAGLSVDGLGTAAVINEPYGIATDAQGNLYVADLTRIRKISSTSLVTTLAGNNFGGFQNGAGANAEFNAPYGVAVDAAGNVYVADSGNSLIRKITASGLVSTFAGNGTTGYADGSSTAASFNHPCGVAVDGAGNVYVADSGNHMIRKITPSGLVTTLAGSTTEGSSDGIGTVARFTNPCSLAVNPANTLLYVVDRADNLIRQIVIR
ncbi:hypothetical protein ACPPVU_06040 [Mucilaginibacter sp. McL0603]|uniref:NHL domain-containing protein n=1 Tax=Mucilaginibacter sp. McL0603 TaxID=3415670 RepID=UPI003CEC5600